MGHTGNDASATENIQAVYYGFVVADIRQLCGSPTRPDALWPNLDLSAHNPIALECGELRRGGLHSAGVSWEGIAYRSSLRPESESTTSRLGSVGPHAARMRGCVCTLSQCAAGF